jgi:hypothetical protein
MKPDTKDEGTDLQTSFEKQRATKVNLNIKAYKHDLDLFKDKLAESTL